MLEQTPELKSEAFTFGPPANNALTEYDLPRPRPLGTRSIPLGPGVSLSEVVYRVAPDYGEASLKSGLEGTVVLYVVVGADNGLSDVLVYRPLSPDLDAKAVEAVRQWRFTPSKINGQPAAQAVLVEVNFLLRPR